MTRPAEAGRPLMSKTLTIKEYVDVAQRPDRYT